MSGWCFSSADHVEGCYELLGRYDPLADPQQGTALGRAVPWRDMHGNSHSVTIWSGRDDRGTERICATWLFCMSGAVADSWKSTMVGRDVFTRDGHKLEVEESGQRPCSRAATPLRRYRLTGTGAASSGDR
ncbi:avidin/streptavidin family protein [Peterkaempfera sp. SMS 1(5)a]|uniref:avidin/streptavidin family protein n=1 Tax=Peterkaempfera podocarpi TaxID=3232308 RepID=UPI00366E1B5E